MIKCFIYNDSYYIYDSTINMLICVTKDQYIEINKLVKMGAENYELTQEKTPQFYDTMFLVKKDFLYKITKL